MTIEQLREAQEKDTYCTQLINSILHGSCEPSTFLGGQRSNIVRRTHIDVTFQIYVPEGELRTRLLFLAHHTPLSGHPGIAKQFYTMRREVYWPTMIADIRRVSYSCYTCARERLKLRSHQSPLKLFPAVKPLESVALDILGPLPKTSQGHIFSLFMTDRFSTMTHTVPLKNLTALTIEKWVVEFWILRYGPPAVVVTDSGSQFASNLFQFVYRMLRVKNAFTTTLHP